MHPSLTRLRADHLEAPLALRRPRPRLTWQLADTAATQAEYRIAVHRTSRPEGPERVGAVAERGGCRDAGQPEHDEPWRPGDG